MGFVEISKQVDSFRLVTILQCCNRLFCAPCALPSSALLFKLSCDFLPSLFPSQIAPLRNVDWNQVTGSFSSMDWTWGVFLMESLLANLSTGGCSSILFLPIGLFSGIFWGCFSAAICSHYEDCFHANWSVTEYLKLWFFYFNSFSFGTFWAACHMSKHLSFARLTTSTYFVLPNWLNIPLGISPLKGSVHLNCCKDGDYNLL